MSLDHKSYVYDSQQDVIEQINGLAAHLDHKHPMQRKVHFLLDVRGFLYLNQLKGNYIEFGSYMSEMQYAAYHILEPTGIMKRYVGLDTFEGEPEPRRS